MTLLGGIRLLMIIAWLGPTKAADNECVSPSPPHSLVSSDRWHIASESHLCPATIALIVFDVSAKVSF